MTHPKLVLAALLMLSGWLTTNHFTPWVSWHAELPFFVLVLVVAAWGVFRPAARGHLAFPWVVGLPLLLSALVGLQYAFGLVPWVGHAVVAALYGFLVLVAIQWGWQDATARQIAPRQEPAPGEWLAWTLVVAGVLSVAVAWVQVLDLWEGASFITRQSQLRRPGGNMGQANHLATLLVMAMAATLFLNLQGRLGLFVTTLTVMLLAAGVALTESRTGLLTVLSICVLWAWKRPDVGLGVPRVFAGVLGAAGVSMFAAWPSLYTLWSGGVATGASAAERIGSSGSDPRRVLWEQVLEASLLKPWAGWGFRGTAEAHNAIAHQDITTLPITYSHNLLLDLAVWFGWPVALIVSIAVMVWGCRRFLAIQTAPLAWFGFALVLPFGIHCLLEFPFAYAYLLMPAMLGVGWIEGTLRPNQAALRVRALWIIPPVLLVVGVAIWSVVDYLRVEEDFRVARFQMLRIGPPPDVPPPQIRLLDQLGDMVASTRVPLKPGLGNKQLELLQMAAVHNPWSGSQYRYAAALALNGHPAEARRQMQVLRAQHGFRAYRGLAEQLEKDLAKHGLPELALPLENP
ncbi:MAG: O-antigen ligase C-terminal domain-containing protein [Hydrogenophaga sp.]|nr:O-antigen ligase C-terminal domain-containing protein [Hydrogenophaga sp.]